MQLLKKGKLNMQVVGTEGMVIIMAVMSATKCLAETCIVTDPPNTRRALVRAMSDRMASVAGGVALTHIHRNLTPPIHLQMSEANTTVIDGSSTVVL